MEGSHCIVAKQVVLIKEIQMTLFEYSYSLVLMVKPSRVLPLGTTRTPLTQNGLVVIWLGLALVHFKKTDVKEPFRYNQ